MREGEKVMREGEVNREREKVQRGGQMLLRMKKRKSVERLLRLCGRKCER